MQKEVELIDMVGVFRANLECDVSLLPRLLGYCRKHSVQHVGNEEEVKRL